MPRSATAIVVHTSGAHGVAERRRRRERLTEDHWIDASDVTLGEAFDPNVHEAIAQQPEGGELTIGRLHYDGGGDWYANPSSHPNLLKAIRTARKREMFCIGLLGKEGGAAGELTGVEPLAGREHDEVAVERDLQRDQSRRLQGRVHD